MSNKYATEIGGENESIKPSLRPKAMISDDLVHSVGLYSKSEIREARYSKFSRFGRILDPYGRVNAGREYLFFVKPDLHICVPNKSLDSNVYTASQKTGDTYTWNDMLLNPQLNGSAYFKYLLRSNPNVITELQYSLDVDKPFSYLLSSSVSSNLRLGSSSANTMDNSSTIFGTTYNYLQDSEASDEKLDFDLEFIDNKNLDTYQFFKAYSEYHIARKSGLVTPPTTNYYRYKRLHNTMGIYKFVVGEDMETIIYWAYVWGAIPKNCPREAFEDPNFSDGLTFSISFEGAFIEDMNPTILAQFNTLMKPLAEGKKYLPIVRQNYSTTQTSNYQEEIDGISSGYLDTLENYKVKNKDGTYTSSDRYKTVPMSMVDGTLPVAALVDIDETAIPNGPKFKYKLKWYG